MQIVLLPGLDGSARLVFCNSFVVAPWSRAPRWLVSAMLFKFPLPSFLLRRYMLGSTADDELLRELAATVASVPSAVLASRVRSVLGVDETTTFARCTMPMLYVRGMQDRLVPDSALRRMAAARQIRTARVPGPHLLLQANPVGAWKAIVPFLESLRNGSGHGETEEFVLGRRRHRGCLSNGAEAGHVVRGHATGECRTARG